MNIFQEVKARVTARQEAERYGLKVSRNGMACCPFHNDKHPSMKIDQNYYCLACGAKGDAISYVAERFGLSQLHQLRGRIGRGEKQSYCIFMTAKKNDATMKRLNILNKSNDGFFIASEDMKLRGPGDLFGIRQSGDMHFNLADIFNDVNILKEAAESVTELLNDDKDLSKPENANIRHIIEEEIRKDLYSTL